MHNSSNIESFGAHILLHMILDALDQLILGVLQRDGRITTTELGNRVGLSPSACLRRVRRLEDDGVISGYVALIDPHKVDRGTSVFVEISLTSQHEELLDEFELAITQCALPD